QAEAELAGFLRGKNPKSFRTYAAIAAEANAVHAALDGKTGFDAIPSAERRGVRADLFLASESIAKLAKAKKLDDVPDKAALTDFKTEAEKTTKYIPDWVKIAVAC